MKGARRLAEALDQIGQMGIQNCKVEQIVSCPPADCVGGDSSRRYAGVVPQSASGDASYSHNLRPLQDTMRRRLSEHGLFFGSS
jgi:hypothetical protein